MRLSSRARWLVPSLNSHLFQTMRAQAMKALARRANAQSRLSLCMLPMRKGPISRDLA